jgi:hypothetical protein
MENHDEIHPAAESRVFSGRAKDVKLSFADKLSYPQYNQPCNPAAFGYL